MSVVDSIVEELGELLAKLPAAAVVALIELVKGALASDDPARYIQRRAAADASASAADAAIEKALGR